MSHTLGVSAIPDRAPLACRKEISSDRLRFDRVPASPTPIAFSATSRHTTSNRPSSPSTSVPQLATCSGWISTSRRIRSILSASPWSPHQGHSARVDEPRRAPRPPSRTSRRASLAHGTTAPLARSRTDTSAVVSCALSVRSLTHSSAGPSRPAWSAVDQCRRAFAALQQQFLVVPAPVLSRRESCAVQFRSACSTVMDMWVVPVELHLRDRRPFPD